MSRSEDQSSCTLCSPASDNVEADADDFMVACDSCQLWFHGRCVNLDEIDAADIEQFHCPSCIRYRGPSVARAKANNNRYDWSDVDGSMKPLQTGSQQFIEMLMKRQFSEFTSDVIVMENGFEFGLSYFEKNSFDRPILFKSAEHLELTLPSATLSLKELGNLVGMTRMVDAIDVNRQRTFRMELGKFLRHFEEPKRSHVLNLISLEVSQTDLGDMITEPEIVRQISWVDLYWPHDQSNDNCSVTYLTPEVSKFCLISMAGSYTDFHIDFSGTSVWYAPVRGCKVFYLIKPTEENLRLFEEWMSNSNHSEQFFADMVSHCSSLTVSPGNVVLIPTGWIHAVLSPADSVVYGGNFLHSYNIELQLKIFDMERRLDLPDKFLFPNFIILHWHVANRLLEILNDYNDEENSLPPYLLNGIQALSKHLKLWQTNAKYKVRQEKGKGCIVRHLPNWECSQVSTTPRKCPKERGTNLKVKIKLDSSSTSKTKPNAMDNSGSPVSERKGAKKRRRSSAVGCRNRKIVPYYDPGLNVSSVSSFNPDQLFDPNFDRGERPLIGYSIQKLYCYPATGSLLMSIEGDESLGQPKSTTYKESNEEQVDNTAATDIRTSRSGRTLMRTANMRNSLMSGWAFSEASEKDSNDTEYVDQGIPPSPPESRKVSLARTQKKGVIPVGQNERRSAAAKQKGKKQKGKSVTAASSRQPQNSKYKTTRERLVRKLKIDTKRMH
ncbi:hypothetical protein M514_07513 [Trichuris suis]|uniref:[histone H3]-dimethyl-L-lysine(36) demethylase n=1 Tax=Trichuris suis TaxID=68888 RepID=A0A085NE77_9BILA|nr:hypothetical protein M514_07513 [Trichuris suis]